MLAATSLSYPLAFAAGVLSFLSPCVFPLVPAYAAFLSGRAGRAEMAPAGLPQRLQSPVPHVPLLRNGVAFVVGFSMVFIALYYLVHLFEMNLSVEVLRNVNRVAGVFVIVMALQTMGVIRVAALMREVRVHALLPGSGVAPSFVLGLTFAAGWTPCIGPQLGAILTVAQNGSVGGLPFMVVYCMGLAVPFLVVAGLADRLQGRIRMVNRHLGAVNAVAGGLLMVFGLLLLTNQLTWLTKLAPGSPFDV